MAFQRRSRAPLLSVPLRRAGWLHSVACVTLTFLCPAGVFFRGELRFCRQGNAPARRARDSRHRRQTALAAEGEQNSGDSPWSVLGVQRPRAGGDKTLMLREVRRAFRSLAKSRHPDVEGGSESQFHQLVWAYNEISNKGIDAGKWPGGLQKASAWNSKDGFVDEYVDILKSRMDSFTRGTFSEMEVQMGPWGSFEHIERETDDDGWGGRPALQDFLVKRHDGMCEGGVHEGDIALYRLPQPIQGRFWGIGEVEAVQGRYNFDHGNRCVGVDGRILVWPLRRVDQEGPVRVIPDECSEICEVRVVDRFEVLKEGITHLGDRMHEILEGSRSYRSVVSSGRVYLAQCDFEEECDMPAPECVYCYEEGCDLETY